MKKLIALVLFLVTLQTTVKADDDKPIEFSQLPQQSQQFIKQNFGKSSIALVKMEDGFFDTSYEVIFTNGDKVEFDKKGVWTDIDCKYSAVPLSSVPVQIKNYVTRNYPNINIIKVEKESRQRYDVELSNGIDLEFDSKFNLIDIDN